MTYQYGYNNQPAFLQPQNEHVYGAQAYQGQQPSPYQQQFYPSPYARIQPQQHQQFRPQPQYAAQTGLATGMGGAGPVGGGGGGGGGGMVPVGGTPQQQQHPNYQQHIPNHQTSYTSAPYPQSSPPKPIVPAQQHYHQASPRISPPRRQSPGTNQPLSQRPMATQAQPHGPVAAQNPGPLQSQQSQQQSQSQSQPQPQPHAQRSALPSPASPTFASREKSRVSTLLEINKLLLQEVVDLQGQGKVVLPNQSPNQQSPTPTPPPGQAQGQEGDTNKPKHSQEFIECMRRLQSNLAYLASIADRSHKPASAIPSAPAIMDAPPQYPSFEDLYAKLRELFPDAKTVTQRTMPQQQKPGRATGGGMMPPGAMAQGAQGAAGAAGPMQKAG